MQQEDVPTGSARRSILRPYNPATDAPFIPVLVKGSILPRITTANILFLTHPIIASSIVALSASALYFLYHNFFLTHLAVREELENNYRWEDYVATGINGVPAVAFIVANFFGLAYWLHRRIYVRLAERQVRQADLLDIAQYYKGEGSKQSSFWVLEFEKEIAACFALDARNPGREIKVLQDAELEEPAAKVEQKEVVQADDEDARDMALFRHSNTDQASTQPTENGAIVQAINDIPAEPTKTSLYSRQLEGSDFEATGTKDTLSSISSSSKQVAELRHFCVSDTFKSIPRVEDYLLKMAINAAFSKTTAVDAVDQTLLLVEPKTQKALRSAALNNGFKIMKSLPLESASQTEEIKLDLWKSPLLITLETILGKLWPIELSQEVLLLDRGSADKRLVLQ